MNALVSHNKISSLPMKSLCITGSHLAPLATIAEPLYQAGLVPAQGLKQGSQLDVQGWHQRVVPMLKAGQSMGRLWEKTAEDILLTNLSDDAWGWHEEGSLWALEFWASLEPGIHFLLVCQSPEAYIAQAMFHADENHSFDDMLEQWRVEHSRMLEFYLQHPERCLLVDASQAMLSPQTFVDSVNGQWQLFDSPQSVMGQTNGAEACDMPQPLQLASALVQSWDVRGLDAVQGLCQELEAAQYPLVATDTAGRLVNADKNQVTEPLQMFQRLLLEKSHNQGQSHALDDANTENQRLASRLAENAQQTATLHAEKEQLKTHLNSSKSELSKLRQDNVSLQTELYEVKARLDKKDAEHKLESESLLQSLHITQEQLEQSLTQRQLEQATLASERNALQQALDQAQQDNNRLAEVDHEKFSLQQETESLLQKLHATQEQLEQSLTQRQSEQSTLASERDALQQALDQADQENERLAEIEREKFSLQQETESLLQNLHTVQEQLEQSLAQRQSEQVRFVGESESLQATLAESQQEVTRLGELIDHNDMLRQQALQESKHLEQECQKLLTDLQSSQERHEHQLLYSQNQRNELMTLQQRLIALKQRGGGGMAADSVSVTHLEDGQVAWVFDNVLIGEQEYRHLRVTGRLMRGNLVLDVANADESTWELDATRKVTLHTLSPAQHCLAQGLPEVLQAYLPRAFESPRRIRAWQRSINKLSQQLAAQPPRLWIESSELRHIQVNPDYEHLWVILRNASFAGSEPVDWQFRLSSANVSPESFGSQPKLEFPHLRHQLLQEWFQESEDAYGEKLELRFALPNDMDTAIWKRLAPHDQQLIQSLIQQLPEILSQLEQQGHNPGREWSEWLRMVQNMQRILRAKAG